MILCDLILSNSFALRLLGRQSLCYPFNNPIEKTQSKSRLDISLSALNQNLILNQKL